MLVLFTNFNKDYAVKFDGKIVLVGSVKRSPSIQSAAVISFSL